MRVAAILFAFALSTAGIAAQRHQPPRPPAPAPAPTFKTPTPPPAVLPFPPLMPQPAGGATPGVRFPAADNPVYSPRRVRPFPGGYVSGGYFYAPDATTAPVPGQQAPGAELVGMLRLLGTPESAQVFVDGYYVGTIGDVEARVLTLPAGPHRIELRANGYVPATFDVQIAPNETITYRAALDRVPTPSPLRSGAPNPNAAKMYLIPNCYIGNVPPKAARLPRGCDIKRVQVIS